MATEQTKADQALSVEERLRELYKLQTILSKIDRNRDIRGELPEEVRDLADHIEGLQTRIAKYNAEIEDLRSKTAQARTKIQEAQAKIAEYQVQLDNVRNNKEFDLLTKEVEYQNLDIQLHEKHINTYAREIEARKADIEAAQNQVIERNQILADKRQQLEEIVSETKKEEERLFAEAKEIEPKIDARTLNAFKRIRKNSRNGLGVVYIQRNACGGCFNRIPPQRQMEIKMHKKIIVCEYCGRIMIDPELAGVVSNPATEA
ncbi:MAG: hypothetical protein K2K55_08955 [Duncaniella sp.]|nr:hypothetical protein [Duncaniella sp.]